MTVCSELGGLEKLTTRHNMYSSVRPDGRQNAAKRPYKLWDSRRMVRKALSVTSYEELVVKGKEKLSLPQAEAIRVVLEADGTQVDDADYFRSLPDNTVFLFLRPGEKWYPGSLEAVRAALTVIPKIVCETLHSLRLQSEAPTWKIMDSHGNITVVLHWDGKVHYSREVQDPHDGTSRTISTGIGEERTSLQGKAPVFVTSTNTGSKKETLIDGDTNAQNPMPTVINQDDAKSFGSGRAGRLSRQGSSIDSVVHIHTPECCTYGTHVHLARGGSPSEAKECDFHCCAIHEEGGKISVNKSSVATSPIQEGDRKRSGSVSKNVPHVRFLDANGTPVTFVEEGGRDPDSSESENETTVLEDDFFSDKFLLLIDQVTSERSQALTIKDIGVILERLSSKIVDVERLERETEVDGCHNWTIRATIRGDMMSELGVVYNGNYYAISEHPGYREEVSKTEEPEIEHDGQDTNWTLQF